MILHEHEEPLRLEAIVQAIKQEKILRHPIMVLEMKKNLYLVIDGVHRYLSLKRLGYKHIPCQIVEESQVQIHAWSHVVKKGPWLKKLIKREEYGCQESEIGGSNYIVRITEKDSKKSLYLYRTDEQVLGVQQILKVCSNIIQNYIDRERIVRVGELDHRILDENFVRIDFPRFTLSDIYRLSRAGCLMPTGITHFLITGRILNLQIPLEVLKGSSDENRGWDLLIKNWDSKLRYYSEPIYICE
ncbi:ParB N-terminal domain-containing protein [Polycladospora coralii]|nr:ParB N-terminal domain-containing protein [Polycladospora coralii]